VPGEYIGHPLLLRETNNDIEMILSVMESIAIRGGEDVKKRSMLIL
jgi:hypothetical protein